MKLYPIIAKTPENQTPKRLTQKTNPSVFHNLWSEVDFGQISDTETIYSLYFNYNCQSEDDFSYDFAIVKENPTYAEPINIDETAPYEIFETSLEKIVETWSMINEKVKNGTLKRAYTLDFEKYLENKILIYISVEK